MTDIIQGAGKVLCRFLCEFMLSGLYFFLLFVLRAVTVNPNFCFCTFPSNLYFLL
jgi:hypothetical protein